MIKAIIFDMDGVIIDSEPIAKKATLQMLRECGVVYQGSTKKFLGKRTIDIMKDLKKQYKLKMSVNQMWQRQLELCLAKDKQVKMMPHFAKIQKFIKQQKYKKALVTSADRRQFTNILKRYKILNYFDYLVSGDLVTKGKPHPEPYLKAAKELKVKPQDCLVIEDSFNGLKSAKAAGMKCVIVRNRQNRGVKFPQANAIVSSLVKINISFINKL